MKKNRGFLLLAAIACMVCLSAMTAKATVTTYYWPVMGHTVLSQGYHSQHKALDISDLSIDGAPVCAVIGGTVYKRYDCAQQHYGTMHTCDGFGTALVIQGDDGNYYTYAHLQANSIPAAYTEGAYVPGGVTIGTVGTTGHSTGSHLHFCISSTSYIWGGDVNPLSLSYQYTFDPQPVVTYKDFSQSVYYIRNTLNEKYMSVSYATDAQAITTGLYNASSDQQMEFIPVSNGYKIRPLCTERVINASGYAVSPGQKVDIWDDSGISVQWWGFEKVSGGYIIRSMQNQNCVLALASDNDDVVVETYTGDSSQIWEIIPKDCKHPSYTNKITKQVTCTSAGIRLYTCKDCGYSYTKTIAKTGHSYTDGKCTRCKHIPTGVKITKQPAIAYAKAGTYAKTQVLASGDGLTYTWYVCASNGAKYYKSSQNTNTYKVKISADTTGRKAYCIIKDKYGNSVKTKTVQLRAKLSITQQPKSVAVTTGEAAKVTVRASGAGLIYRWYYKNAGASKYTYTPTFTGNSYQIKMSNARDGRQVLCRVYDKYGNVVQTNTVKLSIKKTAKITKQPATAYAKTGTYAKTQVLATGDGLTYTWYVCAANGTKYYKSSQNTSTYKVKVSADTTGRKAYCIVTDKYGNAVKTKTVQLRAKLSITQQPKSVAVTTGEAAKVTVKASGAGLIYRWYYKNAGASKYTYTPTFTGNSYQIKMGKTRDGRTVLCRVYDKYGNVVQTNTVKLSMK